MSTECLITIQRIQASFSDYNSIYCRGIGYKVHYHAALSISYLHHNKDEIRYLFHQNRTNNINKFFKTMSFSTTINVFGITPINQ